MERYRQQVKDYAEIKDVKVTSLKKSGDVFILEADGKTYEAERVIVATNIQYDLLEALGFEIEVNENVKSGKIKKVAGVDWEGITSIPNLYIAGLLAGVPSQVMIAAGQGAVVGVRVAQDATGENICGMISDISSAREKDNISSGRIKAQGPICLSLGFLTSLTFKCYFNAMQIFFASVKNSMLCLPPSLPMPLFLYPNGARRSRTNQHHPNRSARTP